MNFITKYFALLAFVYPCNNAYSQTDCAEKLLGATQLYDKGNIPEVIHICLQCTTASQDNTERWQAYRLLTMAYLSGHQLDEARKSAIHMLELNPTYYPGVVKDPAELVKLLNSIAVIPKFSLGLSLTLGGNVSFPIVKTNYFATDYKKSYKNSSAFEAGLIAGYHLGKKLSLHTGLLASAKKYEITYQVNQWDIKVEEKLNYLEVPLFVRGAIVPNSRWRPYAEIGLYGGYLLQSRNDFSRIWLPTSTETFDNNIDSKDRRNRFVGGLYSGIGLSYKVVHVLPGHLSLNVNFLYAFSNLSNESGRYNDAIGYYRYYYLDDELRLNCLSVSMGYTMYLNYKVLK